MLDFLVTSKARRRLLELLWGRSAEGSASHLAALARVGFASAYRELRAMQGLGVVTSERLGSAEVYRANPAHPWAELMGQLVATPARVPDDDAAGRLRGQLKTLGAPLQTEVPATMDADATVEETVVRGVQLAHRDPTVARTLPVCLYRQRETLRPAHLYRHALQLSEKRSLGFFLALTSVLSGDGRFAAWAEELRDGRWGTTSSDFFHAKRRSRLQQRLADQKTPAVARDWGLQMNMDLDAFRSTFTKFVHAA